MESHHILGVTDYIVLCVCLLISLAIGIKFWMFSKRSTANEYMLAGRNMAKMPVVLSICVTIMSALSMLGASMEIYRFGIGQILGPLFCVIGIFLAAYIFIPVYFQCGVSSIYEFLELRFGPSLRRFVSGIFVIQMILFMSVVLYVPALSLSAVSDLSLETSIIVMGLCSSVYCSLGGLKGILWADVFQAALMFICLLIVLVKGAVEAGGLTEIYRKAEEGGRLVLFNFTFDMTVRYTVWNLLARSVLSGMFYGTSQLGVQRMLTFSSCNRARSAICWSTIPTVVLWYLIQFVGLILYSIFYDCDPLLDTAHTGLTKYDQVLPYYIVSRLSAIPGIAGICIAGIFSGSLSSISSALNSLATVTVLDFIKPILNITEKSSVSFAKALTLLYGVICIGFAFLISKADSIQAVGGTLMGIFEGPVTAIFVLGVLTRKGTEKCILISLCLGSFLSSIIGFGYIFGGYHTPSLPTSTSGCDDVQQEFFENFTSLYDFSSSRSSKLVHATSYNRDVFPLFRISFMWFPFIGLTSTLVFALVGILLTGWEYNSIPADSKCLSPVTRLWMRAPPERNEEELNLKEGTDLYTPDV